MHDAKVDAIEIDHLVFLVVHFGRAVENFAAGRPEVRAAAGGRVVPAAGRGRTRLEILRLSKVLADDFRADYFVSGGNKAPVRLAREEHLTHARGNERIDHTE